VSGLLNQLFKSRVPNPKDRLDAVNDYMQGQNLPQSLAAPVNSYSQQVLLTENASATAGLLGVRNSIFVTAFYLKTEAISGGGSALPPGLAGQNNNTQTGVNVVWSHKLTRAAVLSITGFALRTKANAPSTGETNQGGVNLELALPLSSHTTFKTGARYQSLSSNVSTGYNESAIFAGLAYDFK